MKNSNIWLLFGLLFFISCAKKSNIPDYKNPELNTEVRAHDLIAKMTLQQKISQLNYISPSIDSLDVPAYNWWNECLHGVARAGLATVFPQAIGLSASFDEDMMFLVATAISDEARAKHHDFVKKGKRGIYQGLTFWTPNINIFRDPRWGRGMETYGEDPYLTGSLAVQFIKGLQGNDPNYLKLVATSKHFAVHSGPESLRHTYDARVSEVDLRETYLPHFYRTVKEANVHSFMCAYNRFEGSPCCGSSPLLQDILRKEWGFKGYVVSDCWAIKDFYEGHNVVNSPAKAAAMAFRNGTDLNCGSSSPFLVQAVDSGFIAEAEIDTALKRLLVARIKLGMFDPEDRVPYASIPYSVVNSPNHQALALEAAHKSIVLLKNEKNVLPLSKNIKSLAVIGPNANDEEVLVGNYNGTPLNPINPLKGLINKLPKTKINYALGCEHAENLPVLELVPSKYLFTDDSKSIAGLKAEYFDSLECAGSPMYTQVDPDINYYWWDKAPKDDMNDDTFAIRWSGVIAPEKSGKYALGCYGNNIYRIFLNDSQIVDFKSEHETLKKHAYVNLTAGKTYKIRIEYVQFQGDAGIQFVWQIPGHDYEKEALEAVSNSDAVVMFMGLSPRLEGEEMKVEVKGFAGGDRVTIGLPELQENLMKKVLALRKPTVLVLLNGSALAINWANDNIPAIVEAWYPGQAGGTAIADVLFGDYNPAGRLPLTFYKSEKDLPAFDDYNMKGRTYRYFEGKPLYPFGYGLSFTSFEYSQPKTDKLIYKTNESVKLSVNIKNNGAFDGDEVVQVYIKDSINVYPYPIKSLKAFKRIQTKKGTDNAISFTLNPEAFAIWDSDKKEYVVKPGKKIIGVGKSSDEVTWVTTEIEFK